MLSSKMVPMMIPVTVVAHQLHHRHSQPLIAKRLRIADPSRQRVVCR